MKQENTDHSITKIKKLKDNIFELNENVIIQDINLENDDISYNLKYDESQITEKQAQSLANEFILEALENFLRK